MDSPDISQLPQSPNASKPASGTYGDVATADKLKQAMGLGQRTPGPPAPNISPMPGGAKPEQAGGPFGLPASITAPTQQPDVPVSTPLAATPINPVQQAGDNMQKRLAFLDMLARNPDVSDTTREFAQTLIAKLVQSNRR